MKTCIPQEIADNIRERLNKGEITPEVITNMLPEEKQALRSVLEDIVSDNLGIKVSSDEVAKISEQSKKIESIQNKLGNNFGDIINHYEDNLSFLKEKKKMDDLLKSFNPSSKTRVFTGTIGRASMLSSIKSPILNIGSNTINAILEGFTRRLSRLELLGADNKLALDYVKKVNNIYQKTGYDISRAMSDDFGEIGSRVLGNKVSAIGVGGGIGKTGRIAEDIVFKQLMGAPDVAFSSAHFADSVNLGARKLAKGDKKLAKEMMIDAMSLEPQTEAGKLLKAQGILDAQFATYTNESNIAKASEGIRRVLNDIAPNARIGDWVMPFVKTPANVISSSLDYAGKGALKSIIKTVEMIRNKDFTREGIRQASSDMVKSGLGFAGALIIANNLNEDDFVGAYDPARKQIEALRNSNSNSIRIGDKWISLDWFGPLGAPLSGILYAKKYGGNTNFGKSVAYFKGLGKQITRIPGIQEFNDLYDSLSAKDKEITFGDASKSIQKTAFDQLYGRLIPSIVGDIAKASDKYERVANTSVQKIKSKIPGLRQTLPIKQNIFGEQIKTENPFITVLFGSRIKTSQETPMIKKINDLVDKTGKNLSITDFDTSTGKQLQKAKEKLGEVKYNEAKTKYGIEMKKELESLMNSNKYKISSDLEKINSINSLDQKVIKQVLSKYGIKYK